MRRLRFPYLPLPSATARLTVRLRTVKAERIEFAVTDICALLAAIGESTPRSWPGKVRSWRGAVCGILIRKCRHRAGPRSRPRSGGQGTLSNGREQTETIGNPQPSVT